MILGMPARRIAAAVQKDIDFVVWTGDGVNPRTIPGPDLSDGGVFMVFRRDSSGPREILFSTDGSTIRKDIGTGTTAGHVFAVNGFVNNPSGGAVDYNVSGGIYFAIIASKASDVCQVIDYTGNATNRTIAHGLNGIPQFTLCVRRDAANNNRIQRLSNAVQSVLYGQSSTPTNEATLWNSTAADATNVTIGTSTATNASAGEYTLICFSPTVSSQQIYTGNASSSGPSVTGFGYTPDCIYNRSVGFTNVAAVYVSTAMTPGYAGNDEQLPFGQARNTTQNVVAAITNGFQVTAAVGAWNSNFDTYMSIGFRRKP